jgi:hypothetical protein
MIGEYWLELKNKFDNVKLHDFVVMPNHFHGVIEIQNQNKNCDCKICRGAPCGYPNNQNNDIIDNNNENHNQGNHKGCPYSRNIL